MRITNEGELLNNAQSEIIRTLRRNALDILSVALDAVDAKRAVQNSLKLRESRISLNGVQLDLNDFSRIFVVGGGKAGGEMADAIEGILGDRISGGAVNVLEGTERNYSLQRIVLNGASHPILGEEGVRGVEKMLALVDEADEDDLIIVLISGGGSALMADPAHGIALGDLRKLTDELLRCGATINELNSVRKHLSEIKGGRLAKRAFPAMVVGLILSDVVGDPLDVIASGPTSPDSSTFRDAIEVLNRYELWHDAPSSVRHHLESGASGLIEETVKSGDKIFERVLNVVVGSNFAAARAAIQRAKALGYNEVLLSSRIEGEARHVGTVFAGIAREIASSGNPVKPPAAAVAGGETTVRVKGSGRGGRNQELALGAALKIDGLNVVVAALATDGIDGPTDAAGAIADGWTMRRARSLRLSPLEYLNDNDSHGFFKGLRDTIVTGPTGTNVNDIVVILVAPQ